jgi:hypothetical protein
VFDKKNKKSYLRKINKTKKQKKYRNFAIQEEVGFIFFCD